MEHKNWYARVAKKTAHICGKSFVFSGAVGIILVWLITGPLFHFSDTWQLVINTGTTIITFLMVFLIQNTQNRDGAAVQTKLDELIRASDAEDEFMGIEKLTDAELDHLHRRCVRASENSRRILARAEAERKSRVKEARAATAVKKAPRKAAPRG